MPLSDIAAATITWRFQKNGEKNETIWHARNDTQPRNCVIRAMLRIRARAISLNLPNNFPIGVYQNPQLETCTSPIPPYEPIFKQQLRLFTTSPILSASKNLVATLFEFGLAFFSMPWEKIHPLSNIVSAGNQMPSWNTFVMSQYLRDNITRF